LKSLILSSLIVLSVISFNTLSVEFANRNCLILLEKSAVACRYVIMYGIFKCNYRAPHLCEAENSTESGYRKFNKSDNKLDVTASCHDPIGWAHVGHEGGRIDLQKSGRFYQFFINVKNVTLILIDESY